MPFYINDWIITRENGQWIATSDDGDRFVEGAESLDQLIVMIDQIDHPERCSA